MASVERKALILMAFQRKLHKTYGIAYQNLFSEIMRYAYPGDFMAVSPQGKLGDEKNDGFRPSVGAYYQVYAPDKITETKAIKKLEADFQGLYKCWNDYNEIGMKKFYLVMNTDKRGFLGPHALSIKALEKLKMKFHLDECTFLSMPSLEDIFMTLPYDKQVSIIGNPPFMPSVDLELTSMMILHDVIDHIYRNAEPDSYESSLNVPDVDLKIKQNYLKVCVASLKVGLRQIAMIDDFFSDASNITRDQVKNHLSATFCKISKKNNDDSGDNIFYDMLKEITPRKFAEMDNYHIRTVSDSVIALMAYFFETCDIFKEPS